jgi:HEAT repeat protein
VITLAYLKHADAVEALRARLRDPDASVRRIAVGALDAWNGPALLPDFLRSLADEDWQVRVQAAIVLGRCALAGAVRGLRDALRDPYWQVQKEAIASLGKLLASAAVSDLLGFLAHERSELRRAAAYALGELRALEASDALRALVHDADVEVRKAGARALEAIDRERGAC